MYNSYEADLLEGRWNDLKLSSSRNRTEQRIHEVAKLESMSDHEFEDYPAGSGNAIPGHAPHIDMEQDPLFDPLSIPDDGPAPGQIQTEAFMQNMVEIKTEILDDYPVEETGSHHELDIQDDLEVNHRDSLDERPHIADDHSGHETEEEVVEGLSNGLDGISNHQENPADDFHAEENSLTEDSAQPSNESDDVTHSENYPATENFLPAAADDNENRFSEFSELRITSVEGSATTSESINSPTPNYDELVAGVPVVDKPNGFAPEPSHAETDLEYNEAVRIGEYNETEMQQLESLEEMLSFAQSNVAEPTAVSDDANAGYDYSSHFETGCENSHDDNSDNGGGVVGLQVTNSFSFSKESFDDHEVGSGDAAIDESVALILQEVANNSSAPFDPLN